MTVATAAAHAFNPRQTGRSLEFKVTWLYIKEFQNSQNSDHKQPEGMKQLKLTDLLPFPVFSFPK